MSDLPLAPSGGYWIDSGEVRKAGGAAHDIAKVIPEEIKTLYKPSDAAVAGLVGWQTAKAADECLDAWAKALRSLSGMLETTGDRLMESAKGYKAADRRHADMLLPRKSGPPWLDAPERGRWR